MTRVLYLVRHGEAHYPDGKLTETGRRQADLLGARLAGERLTAIHHSPAPRATQTAQLIGAHLPGALVQPSELVGDNVPYVPTKDELAADFAPAALAFIDQFDEASRTHGPALSRAALARFAGPTGGDVHELVVTHSQIVAWFVRAALHAPDWRWLGLNAANAALTIIRYRPGRPADLVEFNDQAHLPAELRWTGFS